MPRSRPQLSITLPRNFEFHYTEGNPPKTPEREVPAPPPRSPHAEGAYRIKRRSRPAVNAVFQNAARAIPTPNDFPIPTIETPTEQNVPKSLHTLFGEGTSDRFLAPIARKVSTLPRTPSARHTPEPNDWLSHADLGESIARPLSACSLQSDSSDTSNGSLTSYPAGDGSCTSPESESPDPFSSRFAPIKRSKAKQLAALVRNGEAIQKGLSTKKMSKVKWTPEMDKHLWSTYLVYLQDPTVTPFKMLPGMAPPLGVCHRVAREARRTWRGGPKVTPGPSSLRSPFSSKGSGLSATFSADPNFTVESPETIKAANSGSNTPTFLTSPANPVWPKSGSSTRRRLRHLCKNKPTIAPHYQRLMQSRSPSPFASSSNTQSRATSRLSEVTNSSPFASSPNTFSTREVRVSLATSTAESMQADGPLAKLAADENELPASQPGPSQEWFNQPPVPFASEPQLPSELTNDHQGDAMQISEPDPAPRLGSPFGFHTWGPSRSRKQPIATPVTAESTHETLPGPALKSPFRLHGTLPATGVHKRRAMHSLEEELSPNGGSIQQSLLDSLFGNTAEGRHRRVRSRGFSLGDAYGTNPLQSLFNPPSEEDQRATADGLSQQTSDANGQEPQTPTPEIRRLGSPFNGISSRSGRIRGPSRHMATSSLDTQNMTGFSSIGETLGLSSIFQPPNGA